LSAQRSDTALVGPNGAGRALCGQPCSVCLPTREGHGCDPRPAAWPAGQAASSCASRSPTCPGPSACRGFALGGGVRGFWFDPPGPTAALEWWRTSAPGVARPGAYCCGDLGDRLLQRACRRANSSGVMHVLSCGGPSSVVVSMRLRTAWMHPPRHSSSAGAGAFVVRRAGGLHVVPRSGHRCDAAAIRFCVERRLCLQWVPDMPSSGASERLYGPNMVPLPAHPERKRQLHDEVGGPGLLSGGSTFHCSGPDRPVLLKAHSRLIGSFAVLQSAGLFFQ